MCPLESFVAYKEPTCFDTWTSGIYGEVGETCLASVRNHRGEKKLNKCILQYGVLKHGFASNYIYIKIENQGIAYFLTKAFF